MTTADHRNSPRSSLFLTARARLSDGTPAMQVKLRNISETGVMAEGPRAPTRGEAISLELRNLGWVDGRVAWVHDHRFGIAFDKAIDPVQVRQAPPPPPEMPDLLVRRPLAVRIREIEQDPSRLRRV